VGSDALVVRYADAGTLYSDTDIASTSSPDNSDNYFVRIAVGQSAYVFKGANSSAAITALPAEAGTYNMMYRTELYFLRPCSIKNSGSCIDDIPTLVRLTLKGNKFSQEALVEGVEQLQFEYGVDSDADNSVDVFQTASAVIDWSQVLTVRASLIARALSKDSSLDETDKEYLMVGDMAVALSGYKVAAADKNYRRKQ